MDRNSTWYEQIPQQNRGTLDVLSTWLRPIRWQWFVTATFPWNVRSETADQKLKQWINLIERDISNRVCFVAGKERKPNSHGCEVPWHFHLLMTSNVAIPKDLLEGFWKQAVAPGVRNAIHDAIANECILVQPYKDHLKGPEYCLKSLNDCGGDWSFRWLELFNPEIKSSSHPNHRRVRQRARFAESSTEKS